MVIRDSYIGVCAVIAGSLLWYGATVLPEVPVHGDVGPGFFPKLIAVALLLVGIGLFAMDAITSKTRTAVPQPGLDKGALLRIASLLLLTILYITGMELAGFMVATAIYLFCCGTLFGNLQRTKLLIFSILCSGILYLVFKTWLRVPLPA